MHHELGNDDDHPVLLPAGIYGLDELDDGAVQTPVWVDGDHELDIDAVAHPPTLHLGGGGLVRRDVDRDQAMGIE